MTDEIKALLDAMHEAAEESFHAAERFGKGSAQHSDLMASFSSAARAYEAACNAAGVPPYATYDED